MLNAKKRLDTLKSLLNLLTDLDRRSRSIDLSSLCTVARNYLDEMKDWISELKEKKKLTSLQLTIDNRAKEHTENSSKTMKSTATITSVKKTASLPLSPINRNFSKNEISPVDAKAKQPDGSASSKKARLI